VDYRLKCLTCHKLAIPSFYFRTVDWQ